MSRPALPAFSHGKSSAAYVIERAHPTPALEPFIDNFQVVTLPHGGPLPRVLPGTGALCFFPLRGSLTVTNLHAAKQQVISEPFLICNRHQVLDFSTVGPARFLVVTFRPGRLRYFTSTGFADLQDRVSSAADLWGEGIKRVTAQLVGTPNAGECVAQVSELLLRLLRGQSEMRLDLLMDTLYLSPGTRISDVAEGAGWSLRHFERLFTSTYGVSPKFFARVTRLQRVARKLALDPVTSLSSSALDAGFFDQSHFVHELRKLAGISPAELARGVRDRPHFYNPKSIDAYVAMLRSLSAESSLLLDEDNALRACRARALAQVERQTD
ncbi:MAG TPA: helix-turn-helix transcriptional regulator [Rhodocyclaceae bacterium]|nr:helix-turn-helix transcriptional regulator [Rhodocyclaceae bacterium]